MCRKDMADAPALHVYMNIFWQRKWKEYTDKNMKYIFDNVLLKCVACIQSMKMLDGNQIHIDLNAKQGILDCNQNLTLYDKCAYPLWI